MDTETRVALSLDLLDLIRKQSSNETPWATDAARERALAAARDLIDLVVPPSTSQSDDRTADDPGAPADGAIQWEPQGDPAADPAPAIEQAAVVPEPDADAAADPDGRSVPAITTSSSPAAQGRDPGAAVDTVGGPETAGAPATADAQIGDRVAPDRVRAEGASCADHRQDQGAAAGPGGAAFGIGRSAPLDYGQRPGTIPAASLPRRTPIAPRLTAEIDANARAGEPFQARLSVHSSDGRTVRIRGCEVPTAAGVVYEAGGLSGTGHRPGEYELAVICD